jgi:hypothetical protein
VTAPTFERKNMPYTYEASRHHSRHQFEENTLEEAIRSAAVDLELGEAWPAKIVAQDGSVIWEQSGPLTTTKTLKALAEKHGVPWPDL